MTRTPQLLPLLVAAIAVSASAAAASNTTTSSQPGRLQGLLAEVWRWRERHLADPSSRPGSGSAPGVRPNTVAAWVLSFLAASVSSAGGVGGGSLFLPILNLVAGLSLKRATAYSSFMVTGGAASNVLYNLACTGGTRAEDGAGAARRAHPSTEEPLLLPCDTSDAEDGNGAGFPWKDVALLVMVWLCFFALHVLIGDKHGKVRTARLSCLIHQLPTSSAYGMMIT